jgi:hypothetical protein
VGQTPKAQGIMQIIKLDKNELKVMQEIALPKGIKCCTFGASKRDPL